MCSHVQRELAMMIQKQSGGCDDAHRVVSPETLGYFRPYGSKGQPTPTFGSGFSMRSLSSSLLLLSIIVPAGRIQAQFGADSAAIRATALDYAEGWYEGNGDRMARALHPELVKRIVVRDTATGRSVLQNMGASALVNGTRHGYGKETPKERRQRDVSVLDIYGNAA